MRQLSKEQSEQFVDENLAEGPNGEHSHLANDELAEQINERFKEFEKTYGLTIERGIQLGHLLIESKHRYTRHGEWRDWLAQSTSVPIRKAQHLMDMARHEDLIRRKNDTESFLTFATAIKLIQEHRRGKRRKKPEKADRKEHNAVVSRGDQFSAICDAYVRADGSARYDFVRWLFKKLQSQQKQKLQELRARESIGGKVCVRMTSERSNKERGILWV